MHICAHTFAYEYLYINVFTWGVQMQVRRRISFNYYQGKAVKFIHREEGKQHVQMALAAGKETRTLLALFF